MICLENVSVKIADKNIIQNVTLNIKERRIGIVGANGSGKSTLVRLIKGLIKPSNGKVTVLNQDVQQAPKRWHLKVGFVFQDPDHQIIFPIVQDDITFSLKNSGLDKETIKERIDKTFAEFNIQALQTQNSYHLSDGQKQMLAIISVIMTEPEVIIFDEPTTLLDLRNRNKIINLIKDLKQSVLVVTHDLKLLEDFDRVIVLENGAIVADGHPTQALEYYVNSMA